MSTTSPDFVEWKEEFICQERGSRVVHYFLKDSNGSSILAVVGRERSLRHMIYVVSEEFLEFFRLCGSEKSDAASLKWRSRREVVDWLSSLLSKQHSTLDHSKSPSYDSGKCLGAELSVAGVNETGNYLSSHKCHFSRNLKGHNGDIVWSGAAWTCGKQLKHYQAFCRSGITISIHSFVLVMAKEENRYLAYLEDMYEDKKGQKKVKVRWFHRSQEVVAKIPPPTPHPREVFITPYAQVISAECVDDLATVLTPEHYEKCFPSLPCSSDRIHLCFRQLRKNRIKKFNLSKLRGYFEQTILSCLDLLAVSTHKLEEEEMDNGGSAKRGTKRSRSCRDRQRSIEVHVGVETLEHGSQRKACAPDCKTLGCGLPGRSQLTVKNVRPRQWFSFSFKIGDKIELLCQDSGIRGCWFRCTVLQISQKRLKIKYEDLQNEDECGFLEEWIPTFKPAAPDKFGMRCSGRLTVRPCPPNEKLANGVFEIGTAVDAWWSDGWWEGVVTGLDSSGDDCLQVYFPGEDVFLLAQRRNLRISRDWIGNQWVGIGVQEDILSAISAVSSGAKVSACKVAESGGSANSERHVPTNSGLDSFEEGKQTLAELATISEVLENSTLANSKRQQWSEDEVAGNDEHDDDSGVDGHDINAQNGNHGDDVDGKLVVKVDVGSAGKTCEAVIT